MATSVSSKRLRIRRADVCVACGRELQAGLQALWYPGPRVVSCIGCSLSDEVTVEAGQPGASALRKYQELQDRREAHAREKLGSVGVALARIIDPPAPTQAWKRGGEGEKHVGARLEKLLAGTGVLLLHDRLVPGAGRQNIDHIAVGPGGITVIDTKNYKGKVRVQRIGGLFAPSRTILSIKGRDQSKLVTGVEKQIGFVREALDANGHADLEIRGALCFSNVDGLPLLGHPSLRGIQIDGARATAKLAKRPGDLAEARVEELWQLIGQRLAPA